MAVVLGIAFIHSFIHSLFLYINLFIFFSFSFSPQIWSAKKINQDDYPGVDVLGKQLAPEGVVAWEVADAAKQRMEDLGINTLYQGSHATLSVGVTMFYLAGQMNAAKEISRKMKKLGEMSKSNRTMKPLQKEYYEEAARELILYSKSLQQRHDVAKFIYEELQIAPWNITGELIDVHIKGDGSGMMKLTGLGDPSGIGEGFSFLREVDTKPSKAPKSGPIGQTAEMKKITGTSDDLRKLTMKQMGRILKSYGMATKQIDTLKRWDRVHVIRDLSTKAASDGIGDGLERFARGEKMKLSEQKQMYRERINVIWKRQIAALVSGAGGGTGEGDDGDGPSEVDDAAAARAAAQQKKEADAKEDSDSDTDDDDFAADLEEEMMDQTEANQLVAGQTGGEASLGQLRSATQDQALSNDARDLAALKRQREEERVAQEGLSSRTPAERSAVAVPQLNRKIIRKRITKTHPDGRQTTTFKFIVHRQEVEQIKRYLANDEYMPKQSHARIEYPPDDKQIGHAMFSDEDDFQFTSRGGGRSTGTKRRGGRRGRSPGGGRGLNRKKDLQFGKLKTKTTKEQRIKKRRREDDEMEVYAPQRKQGTNNRKERGSIRDRRPHVIFSNKLESIRTAVESRPSATHFHKPVNPRHYPAYYEMISHPMDLATIKGKIDKYEYRTADAMLKDFALVKTNAAKFNGNGTMLADEAAAIYDAAQNMVDDNKAELSQLEEAVADQMSTQSKKKKKRSTKKGAAAAAASRDDELLTGLPVDLDLDFELSDDDSD